MCYPFFRPGSLFLLDWVVGPHVGTVTAQTLGLSGGLTVNTPSVTIEALLFHLIHGPATWLPLAAFFPLAAYSMSRLVGGSLWCRVGAATLVRGQSLRLQPCLRRPHPAVDRLRALAARHAIGADVEIGESPRAARSGVVVGDSHGAECALRLDLRGGDGGRRVLVASRHRARSSLVGDQPRGLRAQLRVFGLATVRHEPTTHYRPG